VPQLAGVLALQVPAGDVPHTAAAAVHSDW
jgi:hypothetical protein